MDCPQEGCPGTISILYTYEDGIENRFYFPCTERVEHKIPEVQNENPN